jgi:hypothetical protein
MNAFKQFVINVITYHLALLGLYQPATTQAITQTVTKSLSDLVNETIETWDSMSFQDKINWLNAIDNSLEADAENADEIFEMLYAMCDSEDAENYDEAEASKMITMQSTTESETEWIPIEGATLHPIMVFVQQEIFKFLVSADGLFAEIQGKMLPLEQCAIGDNPFAQDLRNKIAEAMQIEVNETDLPLIKHCLTRMTIEWSKKFDMDTINLLLSVCEILAPSFTAEINNRNIEISAMFYEEIEEPLEVTL